METQVDEAALAARYRALRDKKKAMEKEHAAALAPYNLALTNIESYFLQRFTETKVDSMRFGSVNTTVFKSEIMTCTVTDRAALETWVQEQGGSPAVFTNHISKDFMQQWLEQEDRPPPGVKIDYIVKANVRKS